ncbi:hypothetical protein ET445_02695 [Agromyces protaetiae]|uniref:Alpha/beta hydrolase n=1 Tax=Agromyces protaetiae TaxID=2509455 RepID=A0A4P6FPJ0_9MICO|nr:alpha/beta hydrolase [Agromyces protaetiae]QAY72408.1 hypothetical protein ET445_02695 [Agromyces protaetiae]
MRGIVVPGIDGSGETHWQTRWEAADPALVRFAPTSWSAPDRDDWRAALTTALHAAGADAVVIAHSLGCLASVDALGTIAEASAPDAPAVRAALLVAPPDVDGPTFPAAAATFRDIRPSLLGTPALVVASEDDPFSSPAASRAFAAAVGAEIVFVGARGHLNGASGLGDWAEGLALLESLAGVRADA